MASSAALSMLIRPKAATATIVAVITVAIRARSTRCTRYPSKRRVKVKSVSRRFS